jgi:hypothetical protein
MTPQLIFGALLFTVMHVLVWWGCNAQFIEGWTRKEAIALSAVLSLPITFLAFFASKNLYEALDDQLWAVRFVAFGISYFVFPILTWHFLGESMFTTKTIVCILLSCLIIYVQIRF